MFICKECGAEYTLKYKYGKKYLSKRKFCSVSCMIKNKQHRKTFFKDGHIGHIKKGEDNYFWKGEKAGYSSKHKWVGKNKQKKHKCEHCGTEVAKRYEWANIDHKYRRKIEDYIELCCSCHYKYDRKIDGLVIAQDNILNF